MELDVLHRWNSKCIKEFGHVYESAPVCEGGGRGEGYNIGVGSVGVGVHDHIVICNHGEGGGGACS